MTGELDEHHGLRIGDLEAVPATGTEDHVVNAHEIVTRLSEFRSIEVTCSARDLALTRPAKPSDFELRRLSTLRACIPGTFGFGLLGVEISFIHDESVIPKHRGLLQDIAVVC